MSEQGVAPGWYYDAGTGGQRWWDGSRWTEHTRSAATWVPQDRLGQQQTPTRLVPLSNPPATAGLVLGIIAVVFNTLGVVSVVGIVLSSVGLRRANRLQRHGYPAVGKGRAAWGLGLSIFGLVFTASLKAFLF